MLFTLGMGSVIGPHGAITTNIVERFPSLKYWQVALGFSIFGFLAGLLYVTPGGQWMLTLVDHFGGTFLVFALTIVEMAAIVWIYGLESFCNDVEFMLNRKVTLYWRLCWGVVTPCLLIVIFVYNMISLQSPTYGRLHFPDGYLAAGWNIYIVGLLQLPLWGAWVVSRNHEGDLLAVIILPIYLGTLLLFHF